MHSVHRGGGGEEILDRHRSRHLGPPPIVTAVYVSISTPVWTNTSTRTSRILLQISTWLFDCFLSQSSSSTAALGFCRHSGPNFADPCDNAVTMCAPHLVTGDCDHWPGVCHRCPVLRAPLTRKTRNWETPESRRGTGRAPSTAGSDQRSPPVCLIRRRKASHCLRKVTQVCCVNSWIILLGDEGSRQARESGCQNQDNRLVINC